MNTIASVRRRFEALDVLDTSQDAIDATSEQYLDQQKEQMKHGLRPDGSKIGEYALTEYAELKYAMNPLAGFGNVDLKLTGAFQMNTQLNVIGEEMIIESLDSKAQELEEKYGDVFGIGGEFKEKYVTEYLQPVFIQKVKDKVKL